MKWVSDVKAAIPPELVLVARWLFMIVALAWMGTMYISNLPANPLSRTLTVVDTKVFNPLGMYTHGWRMFTGNGTAVVLSRTALVYESGRIDYIDAVPNVTTPLPSTWHKVRENLQGAAYPLDMTYVRGYLVDRCKTYKAQAPEADELLQVRIETTRVEIDQLRYLTNFDPNAETYKSAYVWDCASY